MKKPIIILPANHYDLLRERVINLHQLLTEELISPNHSHLYAGDLMDSIENVEKELKKEKV